MRKITIATLAAALVAALTVSGPVLAGKGGNGGGKGGGGGDDGGGGTPASPEIAWVQSSRRGTWDVMVMDADGGNATRVVADVKTSLSTPSWSPDGTELVFSAGTGFGQGRGVYRAAVDGSTGPSLVATAGTTVSAPAWSPTTAPDGYDWIAFTDYRVPGGVAMDVWIVDPAGGTPRNLTSALKGSFRSPCWSPDATQIAVKWHHKVDKGTVNEQTRNDLVLLNLVTDAWGDLIVDVTDVENLSNRSGSPLQDLANEAYVADQEYDASWGRTADTLVVTVLHVVNGKDNYDLYEIPIATPASVVRLTATTDSVDGSHTVGELHPSYAPDDSLAVFWLRGKGKSGSGIYTISLDANRTLTALVSSDSVRDPSWFPGN